jgi:gallate dioxygenase
LAWVPEWPVADEGGGARNLPPVKGHPRLASHIGHSLMADEFDMSFFQNRALDHGCFSPLSMLCPHEPEWPVSIVPLQMGVLQFPVPSARRFYKLGQALRRAIESYPEDLRVAIAATGGLSHQVHGERAGFNNPAWDSRFLDLFERDPEELAAMTIAEYAELGGFEGAEVVMWLTMRGALPANVVCRHRSYYLPSMTGIATAVYEGVDEAPNPVVVERQRRHAAHELNGVEKLDGTYPFTLERSVKAYRINDYLHRMVEPGHREAFLRDPEASFEAAGLAEEERDLIRRRDWRGMMHYGVIFFMLEKLGAANGRFEPAHLRRDARRNARSLPAHAQCARRAVLGGGQGSRKPGVGQAVGRGEAPLSPDRSARNAISKRGTGKGMTG